MFSQIASQPSCVSMGNHTSFHRKFHPSTHTHQWDRKLCQALAHQFIHKSCKHTRAEHNQRAGQMKCSVSEIEQLLEGYVKVRGQQSAKCKSGSVRLFLKLDKNMYWIIVWLRMNPLHLQMELRYAVRWRGISWKDADHILGISVFPFLLFTHTQRKRERVNA